MRDHEHAIGTPNLEDGYARAIALHVFDKSSRLRIEPRAGDLTQRAHEFFVGHCATPATGVASK